MGRTILITGASSGIGEATAREAVAKGWNVALGARNEEKLSALAAEFGDQALALPTDVTEHDQLVALATAATERFGSLDAVFANAGFGAKRGFMESTPELWREMILTNILGCALTIRAAMPQLRESKGHFLLTGSVAGTRALPGSLYSATKFAVHGIAEALRKEVADSGVRTTVIAPGMVDTAFFDDGADPGSLTTDDVVRAVFYALEQPPSVDVNMVLVRPTAHPG